MKRYSFLPHTADIRLKIEADSLPEFFNTGLHGMAEILLKNRNVKSPLLRREIKIAAPDLTALLIDFLSEVLTLSNIEQVVFIEADFQKLNKTSLHATIKGTRVAGFDEDIKAVTYHEARIERDAQGKYKTIIIFDI